MSRSSPDADPGPGRFLHALDVRRNARAGVAVGVVVAAVVFGVFVFLPDTPLSPVWYVGLALVLAAGVALLATLVLLLVSAGRLAAET